MIQSMTGYGTCVAAYDGKKIHVEIRSLNSKALDLNTRIAPLYREKEMDIRSLIASKLERGKVDAVIWVEKDESQNANPINTKLVADYYKQVLALSSSLGLAWKEPSSVTDWMQVLLRLPDVTAKTEIEELTDDEWEVTKNAVEGAIERLVNFRMQEGKALEAKFREKITNISNLLASIEPFEKSRTEKIRQRIVSGLEQIPEVEYDKNRLEQEMIYYIEKLDISEEKQRLANHLKYFIETMETGHGQGKKLGFIAQEMGREINTTGSKSNQAEMQNIVVKMKDELEQIKEQVLNVM